MGNEATKTDRYTVFESDQIEDPDMVCDGGREMQPVEVAARLNDYERRFFEMQAASRRAAGEIEELRTTVREWGAEVLRVRDLWDRISGAKPGVVSLEWPSKDNGGRVYITAIGLDEKRAAEFMMPAVQLVLSAYGKRATGEIEVFPREAGGPAAPGAVAERDGEALAAGPPVDGEEAVESDPLFQRALEVVRVENRASASLLQRRFGIGYVRACSLLEMMRRAGAIGGDPVNPAVYPPRAAAPPATTAEPPASPRSGEEGGGG